MTNWTIIVEHEGERLARYTYKCSAYSALIALIDSIPEHFGSCHVTAYNNNGETITADFED